METFDISRSGFNPFKHYSGVRMQQGRILTDDDFNEDRRIEGEQVRRDNLDIIGPSGSRDDGFRIINPGLDTEDGCINFDILPGRMYVGGFRFELERKETFIRQKDWLQKSSAEKADNLDELEGNERYDLVYLEAWQQSVTATEDGELFETALGGADTGARIRNMRQVKVHVNIGEKECSKAWQIWKENQKGTMSRGSELKHDEHLKVTFQTEPGEDNLCTPQVAGGYLGAENQAIRVQLTSTDKFTWGFDNASPLYRVTVKGKTVTFQTAIKDQAHWPVHNRLVEILPWSALLANGEKIAELTGSLIKVESYDPDKGEITLQKELPIDFDQSWYTVPAEQSFYFLRIWDRGPDLESPETIPFVNDTSVPLGKTGLNVTFSGSELLCGDFWIIAARPNTPNRVVPWKLEVDALPHGIRRFFSPLAIIRWYLDNKIIKGEVVHDCRRRFRPLTDLKQCITFTVGDGIHSNGDYNSIEDAVDNLPPDGGRICVLTGEHQANVTLSGRSNICISGCGESSVVKPLPDNSGAPIFLINSCLKIELSQLSIFAPDGTAVMVEDTQEAPEPSSEILVSHNNIVAWEHAITVNVKAGTARDNNIRITDNKIGMIDREYGLSAIFCLADGVLIGGNNIIVTASGEEVKPDDTNKKEYPWPFLNDPCTRKSAFLGKDLLAYPIMKGLSLYINKVKYLKQKFAYKAKGGIEIGSTSERISIVGNEIIGGCGNGITLGHLPVPILNQKLTDLNDEMRTAIVNRANRNYILTDPKLNEYMKEGAWKGSLYGITIKDNHISEMGLSGISVCAFFSLEDDERMVCLSDLTIQGNSIIWCAQQIPSEIPDRIVQYLAYGGITLSSCDHCIIKENRIEDNGVSHFEPVCGVFISSGDRIEIADNHIINNGPRIQNSTLNIRKGNRGGIIINMALKSFLNMLAGNPDLSSFDGLPAAVVRDNMVMQPFGHALILMAMGPVSVVSNSFTSQGVNSSAYMSIRTGSVFILNLGISKDFLFRDLIAFQNIARIDKVTYKKAVMSRQVAEAVTFARNPNAEAPATPQEFIKELQMLPSGNTLFSGNQTTLDLRNDTSETSFSSQIIASFDDISFDGNQSECISFQSLEDKLGDTVLVNTVLLGITIRANNNRLQEGSTISLASLLAFGYAAMALGNQATHCIHVTSSYAPDLQTFEAINHILNNVACTKSNNSITRRHGGKKIRFKYYGWVVNMVRNLSKISFSKNIKVGLTTKK